MAWTEAFGVEVVRSDCVRAESREEVGSKDVYGSHECYRCTYSRGGGSAGADGRR